MSGIKNKDLNNRRRQLLLGGLAVGATGLLQACGGGSGGSGGDEVVANAATSSTAPGTVSLHAETTVGTVTTPAPIPSHVVKLADYGGVPGASASTIKSAFSQAFNQLKGLGGGTLMIAAGVYDIGSYPSEVIAMGVDGLQNVLISAYGAQLTMTTTAATGMPVFLSFSNPQNVTIAGMRFYDHGTNLSVNWKGAVCLSVTSNIARSGFKTVDCVAENVGTFFRSVGNYLFTNFDIHGSVTTAYYAVNVNNNGRFSKFNVRCDRVRRALVAWGAQNQTHKYTCNHVAGGLGSNGFVDLVPRGGNPVSDVTVEVSMTGNSSPYGSIINCYQQAPDNPLYMRNVKAKVIVNNVAGSAPLFEFMHEDPVGTIRSTTPRTWENMELTGSVTGAYAGPIIRNRTTSTGSTNLIRVASNLAALQNMSALPSYFKVFTPTTQCSA